MFPDSTVSSDWSRVVPVFVAVLVVLSGCQAVPTGGDGTAPDADASTTAAPTSDGATTDRETTTGATTTRPGRRIEVEDGTLPVDQNAVWERVAAMLGADVGPPSTVRMSNLSTGTPVPRTPFERALGLPASNISGFAGVVPASKGGSVVELHRALVDAEPRLESTLAHEYVHVVQMRTRTYFGVARTIAADDGDASRDQVLVLRAVREGTAEYVERRYADRHLDTDADPTREQHQSATTTKRLLAPYHFGAQYVNETVDGPDELEAIYENPPRTTEELLHALEPESEPRAALSVSADSERRVERSGPYGELYVRTLFGTALDEPAAARLADGWGNDTRIRFGGEDASGGGFAWVLRWDDAANATEFADGVESYLDVREPEANVSVERVAPETTVLFVGSESFLAEASASGENATVTVSM